MHAVIGTMDGESAAPQIGIAGSEISRRLGPRQIGVSKGIRSVASITICRPFQIALYSIDHTAISTYAAVTEN
jgi:hypothetical protein